ncbi:hypothetical protein AMTRI_Chr01g103950 [Amborella trichopoda]
MVGLCSGEPGFLWLIKYLICLKHLYHCFYVSGLNAFIIIEPHKFVNEVFGRLVFFCVYLRNLKETCSNGRESQKEKDGLIDSHARRFLILFCVMTFGWWIGFLSLFGICLWFFITG